VQGSVFSENYVSIVEQREWFLSYLFATFLLLSYSIST